MKNCARFRQVREQKEDTLNWERGVKVQPWESDFTAAIPEGVRVATQVHVFTSGVHVINSSSNYFVFIREETVITVQTEQRIVNG